MRRIYKSMLLLCKEQKGAVKILVGLSMFMLIGFAAFVVDAGSLYFEKSSLQKSLDAAVLGGAQRLLVSGDDAKEVAMDLADQNGFEVSKDDMETGENFIEINKIATKNLFFARVLGFQKADVSATARAEILNTLIAGEGIIPVALEQGEYQKGKPYTMHFQTGKGTGKPDDDDDDEGSISGNFGFLAIDGPGGKDLKKGIMNGTTREINEEFEWTKTGLSWGNVRDAFQWRIDQDEDNSDKSYCNDYQTADNTCSRVVIVPMIEPFTDENTGKSKVRIVGFSSFWIDEVIPNGKNKAVIGRFIDVVESGTFGPGENYGVYGVKLVK